MPRSTQAAAGSFRFSGRLATSASASSHRPVSKSSWPRAPCAWARRIAVPTWSASSVPARPRSGPPRTGRDCPASTALLICSSSRRSVSAGSACGHGQRPVEQRQRVGHVPLHPGHQRQHVQRPAHGPVVARLRRRRERTGGDPARLLDLAEVAVRPRGEHEQPGAVPGGDAGRGQRPVQRGQGLRGPSPPACGTAPASSAGPRADRARRRASARFATRSASATSPMR